MSFPVVRLRWTVLGLRCTQVEEGSLLLRLKWQWQVHTQGESAPGLLNPHYLFLNVKQNQHTLRLSTVNSGTQWEEVWSFSHQNKPLARTPFTPLQKGGGHTAAAPGAEPPLLLHGHEMPRMLWNHPRLGSSVLAAPLSSVRLQEEKRGLQDAPSKGSSAKSILNQDGEEPSQ